MLEPKRARRIRDKLRMKAKAAMIGRLHGLPGNWDKVAEHLAVCSCQMCRNPRRSTIYSGLEKLTMQERKAIEGWGGLG